MFLTSLARPALKWVFGIVVAITLVFLGGKVYNSFFLPSSGQSGNSNPVVGITPVPVTSSIQHQLPGGQHGVTQVDVPNVNPTLGNIPTQHIVVTDQGNTLVVTTNKIDWGFRLQPKIYLGMANRVFVGLGGNIFTLWRFNTDVFAATSIDKTGLFSESYLGTGLSFQVAENTFLGLALVESSKLTTGLGASLNLRF